MTDKTSCAVFVCARELTAASIEFQEHDEAKTKRLKEIAARADEHHDDVRDRLAKAESIVSDLAVRVCEEYRDDEDRADICGECLTCDARAYFGDKYGITS